MKRIESVLSSEKKMQSSVDSTANKSDSATSSESFAALPSTDPEKGTSHDEPPSLLFTRVWKHNKELLQLKFPRCCICKVDWYLIGEDGDQKPSAIESDSRTGFKRSRPSHTNLLPLPECKCISKMAAPLNGDVGSLISDKPSNEQSANTFLSDVQIHEFRCLGICKTCLPKRIESTDEVLRYDYQQDDVENGQRSIKYNMKLDCVLCDKRFLTRQLELAQLEKEGNRPVRFGGTKTGTKKEFSWFDSVDATIKLVGWAKDQKRRAKREARMSRKLSNGYITIEDDASSNELFSLCSDSDVEERKPTRNIAQQGEIRQFYEQERIKYQMEKDKEEQKNLKLAKELLTPEEIDDIEKREEDSRKRAEMEKNDLEIAKKMQEEEDQKQKSLSHSGGLKKRKAETPNLKTLFSKQSKTEPSAVSLNSSEEEEASTSSPEEGKGLDKNVSTLMEMACCSERAAKQAIIDANGDLDTAATILLTTTQNDYVSNELH